MVVFGRPLLFSNPFEEDDSLCCFHEILRQKDMTVIEKIEFLNVQERATTVKSGENLLSFRSFGLNAIPVYLIKESASSLKQRWLQDSDRTRIECSKQLVHRLSAVILPLLKRRQEVQLDLRENKEINILSLIHTFDEISALNCQILDDKKKLFANKLLLLNFLRNGFGIDRQALMIIKKKVALNL